jgi:hypothetical protein
MDAKALEHAIFASNKKGISYHDQLPVSTYCYERMTQFRILKYFVIL